MKKILLIIMICIVPALVIAQDNVKLDKTDNKKSTEKSGRLNNPAIKKSKKKMDKQMAEFDSPKYDSRVYHGKPPPPNGDDTKGKKPDKKEQKKEL